MAYKMSAKRLRRPVQCGMDHCRSRDTYLFYKGSEIGKNPIHLCGECIRDIVTGYIALAGAETALGVLSPVLDALKPVEEPAAEEVTADEPVVPRRRRKADME